MTGSAIHAQNIGRIEGHVGWWQNTSRQEMEYDVFYVYDYFRYLDIIGGIQIINSYDFQRVNNAFTHTNHPERYISYTISERDKAAVMLGLRGKYAIGDRLQLSATLLAGYGLYLTEEKATNIYVFRTALTIIPVEALAGISYSLSNRTSVSLHCGPSYELIYSGLQFHLNMGLSVAL